MTIARAVLGMVLATCAGCSESIWPDLPDPVGLGPRLATIDWLKEHHVVVPAGAPDRQIIDLYTATSVAQGRPASAPVTADAAESEAISRLRYTLRARHGIDAPPEADRATLLRLLAAADQAQRDADARLKINRLSLTPEGQRPSSANATGTTQTRQPPLDPPPSCAHIEVLRDGETTWTVYRFTDGSANVVFDERKGDGYRRRYGGLPPAPSDDRGWGTCASNTHAAAFYLHDRILLRNASDHSMVVIALISGHRIWALVPANSFRESVIPYVFDPIQDRCELSTSVPKFEPDVSGIPVLLPP